MLSLIFLAICNSLGLCKLYKYQDNELCVYPNFRKRSQNLTFFEINNIEGILVELFGQALYNFKSFAYQKK